MFGLMDFLGSVGLNGNVMIFKIHGRSVLPKAEDGFILCIYE